MSIDPKIFAIRDAVNQMNQSNVRNNPYMAIYTVSPASTAQYDIIYFRLLNENMYYLKTQGFEYHSHKPDSILNYNQVIQVLNSISKGYIITQISAGEEVTQRKKVFYDSMGNVFGAKRRPVNRRKAKN